MYCGTVIAEDSTAEVFHKADNIHFHLGKKTRTRSGVQLPVRVRKVQTLGEKIRAPLSVRDAGMIRRVTGRPQHDYMQLDILKCAL